MIFVEHVGKALLGEAGIAVPSGELAGSPVEAEQAAARLGACVVKAQLPTSRIGKTDGLRLAGTPADALGHAHALLGMEIDGHVVREVLVEGQVAVIQALRVAVVNDPETAGPLILLSQPVASAERGVVLFRLPVDIRSGVTAEGLAEVLPPGLVEKPRAFAATLAKLYEVYIRHDAELLVIDRLALTPDGRWMALDCDLVVDDRAAFRQPRLAALAAARLPTASDLEACTVGLDVVGEDDPFDCVGDTVEAALVAATRGGA
jgi:succinyl-CoA synthetase beta subunit